MLRIPGGVSSSVPHSSIPLLIHTVVYMLWDIGYSNGGIITSLLSLFIAGRAKPSIEELTDPNGRFFKRMIDVSYPISTIGEEEGGRGAGEVEEGEGRGACWHAL